MTRAEREALRALLPFVEEVTVKVVPGCGHNPGLIMRLLPALLDQVDELERKYRNGYPAGVVANAEDALAERDALKAAAAAHKCHAPLEFHDRLRDLENENCQLEAERDQARAECERWRHDYNELSASHSQARARVEELAHVEADLGGQVATLEAALREALGALLTYHVEGETGQVDRAIASARAALAGRTEQEMPAKHTNAERAHLRSLFPDPRATVPRLIDEIEALEAVLERVLRWIDNSDSTYDLELFVRAALAPPEATEGEGK